MSKKRLDEPNKHERPWEEDLDLGQDLAQEDAGIAGEEATTTNRHLIIFVTTVIEILTTMGLRHLITTTTIIISTTIMAAHHRHTEEEEAEDLHPHITEALLPLVVVVVAVTIRGVLFQ